MLLVCMITVMANYGIRNGPKNTNMSIYRNGLRYWRQQGLFFVLFYIFNTEPNPQRSVKEHKKDNRWPIYCHGVMLLRQIYSILVFLFAQLLARFSYTEHVRLRAKKRLVTTPEGLLVRPCSWSRCVFNTPAWARRRPVPSHMHTHTHKHTHWHMYFIQRRCSAWV